MGPNANADACMQGLEVTVGKEQWTIKSGNRVLATRTQVSDASFPVVGSSVMN